ncbi:cell adhesion molecule 3-like [Protopterus annectens]|uniref:cell adhesion molecule 3-like n=1 Tax=Protopterus annectens TaxID=7888 RepID=UPI001CF99342|nr:cell adhesion molecule 3-like [Protopterus annectens]
MILVWLCLFTISATVEILHDDHWMHQPVTSDKIVKQNDTVVLNCTVQDNDEGTLQWSNPLMQTLYFGDKKALRDKRIKLMQSTDKELTISISRVTIDDEGVYTCTLMAFPAHIAKATVTVLGVPTTPKISGYGGPVQEGGSVELECETTNSRPPAKLLWFLGEQQLNSSQPFVAKEANHKTYTVISSVEVTVSKEDNEATVLCVVEHDSIGPREKVAEQIIEVLYPPLAKIVSTAEFPEEGEDFSLICEVDGNPMPNSFYWEKVNEELPGNTFTMENRLVFESLNKTNDGNYVCLVKNLLGSSKANFALFSMDSQETVSHASSIKHEALLTCTRTNFIRVLMETAAVTLYIMFFFL